METKPMVVTERMLKIHEPFNVRLWIDVTELTSGPDALAKIASRCDSLRKQIHHVIQGKNNTFEAFKEIRTNFSDSGVLNAFEVTDANGDGYIHYFNWP